MKYLKKFEGLEETTNFNSFLTKLDDLKQLCDGQLATLYDEGFELDYLVTKVTDPNNDRDRGFVLDCLHIQLNKFRRDGRYSFKWVDVKDYYIPVLELLVRRYYFLPYFDSKTKLLKMREEQKKQIMLSTQVCFEIGYGNSYSMAHSKKYMFFSLKDIINDNVDLGSEFMNIFSIAIKIGGEL